MNFAAPENLIYLWLVPLAMLMLALANRRRSQRVRRIAGGTGSGDTVRIAGGRALFKNFLLVAAFTCALIALARPQWGFEWQAVRTTGADVIIAIDVSNSMLATDIDPSRLERAKREVIDLLALMRGDRVGLVAFAGDAYVQCPLTEDYAAARMFINYLDTSLVPIQGTDLGKAIRIATQALVDGGPDSTAGRAIILITDGEDQEGNAKAAAAEAKAKNVKLFTIGIGSRDGAPIPLAAGGFKKDASGNMVVTKPDERILQEIAVDTGGVFVRSVAGDMDLQKIYSQGVLQNVERGQVSESRKKLWFERFQWFLGAAFLLLLIESALRDVVIKRAASAAGLAIALTLSGIGSRAEASPLKDAHEAFEANQFDKAADGFLIEEATHPDDPEITYNRAVSQFRQGKLEEAARGFDKSAKAPQKDLAQRSLFNRGNAYAGLSKFDDAIKSYEEALKLAPDDKDSQDNLAAVKKLKELQKQQQEQKPSDQQKNQQGSGSDQQQQHGSGSDQQQQGSGSDQQQAQQGQQGSGSDQQQPQGQNGSASDQHQAQQGSDAGSGSDKQSTPSGSDQQGGGSDSQQQASGSGSDQTTAPTQADAGSSGSGSDGAAKTASAKDHRSADQQANERQAEQVLRSVDDQARKYLGMPKVTKKPRVLDKDW